MEPMTPPRFARRFWPPLLLGLIGVASLPLRISDQIANLPLPPSLAALPHAVVVALSLVNPLLLLLAASALGAACAHRTGLGSWVAGTAPAPHPRDWLLALGAGLATSLVVALLDAWWTPYLGEPWQAMQAASTFSAKQLIVGVLYGGLAEEVMMRWGLMSLLVWMLTRVFARREATPPAAVFIAALLISAALFAAGHLPALMAFTEPNTALVFRTLALNLLAGAVYGWLFWRRALEIAMAAHAATHAGFALTGLVL